MNLLVYLYCYWFNFAQYYYQQEYTYKQCMQFHNNKNILQINNNMYYYYMKMDLLQYKYHLFIHNKLIHFNCNYKKNHMNNKFHMLYKYDLNIMMMQNSNNKFYLNILKMIMHVNKVSLINIQNLLQYIIHLYLLYNIQYLNNQYILIKVNIMNLHINKLNDFNNLFMQLMQYNLIINKFNLLN